MARRLQSADDLLAPAIADTIKHLEPADTDAAAVSLAKRYAAIIDRAESAVADADAALALCDDPDTRHYIQALRSKVEAKELLEKLGPKLLAVLESLGATPVARSRLKGGGAADGGPSRLEAMRAARGA